MTFLWTASEAAQATGGIAGGDWNASGVSIDSRTVAPGDLFVALGGPTFDGHDFAAAALAAGAAAAMVARVPEGIDTGRLLVVGDTLEGLHALARRARLRSSARVIAVTGSVGKTGTKEMLKLALERQAPTHASTGNLNNHWGLPLSLARMPAGTVFAVLEMGMNHPGEITPLSELACPDVAVITTVEAVHSEFFPSIAAIADAKAEIFAGMGEGGIAILNRDSPYFDRMARAALARGISIVIGFGTGPDAEIRLLEYVIEGSTTRVTASMDDHPIGYTIGAAGRHWAINSLAAIAAADAAGANVPRAMTALADMTAPKGRGARRFVTLPDGCFELIDESYNASPVSTAAALAVLGAAIPGENGRRIAVLGDMRELGAEADALHAGLAAHVVQHGIDLVFTAGPHMACLRDALPDARRGGHAASAEALAPTVAAWVRAGDVVMVKGSAGSRTGVIARALCEMETPALGGLSSAL
ncbi:MAG: UDP-N-acetylmuramoyl-tripeptide--D-alanyl-D-alanine ligase [Alphaproteobacteria bacterium]|nr:UDP-N-acetylmuramoyl-tripeptide--D-alanyl-D-alanine ligase [Alphaproteobacteria bacterium]